MNFYNLHTHSKFCDGKGNPEEYVLSAIQKGFHTIGFSSHAPVPFPNNFAISDDKELQEYSKTIKGLKQKYSGQISVYCGLEIDYIEGITRDFDEFRKTCDLDYVIGSVHLLRNEDNERLWFIDGPDPGKYDEGLKKIFNGDIRQAVTRFFEQQHKMIDTQKPDIIGHFDKIKMHNKDRFFREDESWYRDLVMELIEVIEKKSVIIEINTRGIYKKRYNDFFPGQWILKILKERNIPVTLSADAHSPDEIDGYYPEAIEIIRNIGFKKLVCYSNGGWGEQEV